MANRDIWSRAGTLHVRDLLASLLSTRLLAPPTPNEPLYVCSPFLTDFPLFDNALGQFRPLFHNHPEFGQQPAILFSQALIELSHRLPIRLIGVPGEYADAFLRTTLRAEYSNISGRYASKLHHEKGLLCTDFYLEGSMNFTFSGVYSRDEKITVHTPDTAPDRQKIAAATLEFNRLWSARASSEIRRT